MSQQLISLNPDLKRLRDEGYGVRIVAGHLVVDGVPYVNSTREVKIGTLVTDLVMAGERTLPPMDRHVVFFAGEYPCHKDGTPIEQIRHQGENRRIDDDLVTNYSFSSKPHGGYTDYFHKMDTYANIISSPAEAIDPAATARTFSPVTPDGDESVFNYLDTASSRAGITNISRKLESAKIGIVGLGGTGSYVLDLVAKTWVREIHLFDGDKFSVHNAFRAPGAPSLDELNSMPTKVEYLSGIYSRMRKNVIPHGCYIDESTVDLIQTLNFVFLCLDNGSAKRLIVTRLGEWGLPFVDTGMGLRSVNESLLGILRTTASTPLMRGHVQQGNRISFADAVADEAYASNIQIADLNALNAALAVIKWKKLCGFYLDLEKEHHSTYMIDGNVLINEDHHQA